MVMMTIQQLLEEMVRRGASDLHITAGVPPIFRIDGELIQSEHEILKPEMTQKLAYSLMNDTQKKRYEQSKELDLSFGIPGLSRFRANAYLQRGCVALAVRTIPFDIRGVKELGLPLVISELAERPKGLVLVTGPTGCGKSTTLAAIIEKINQDRKAHVVTIEDPIEYIFAHKKCMINQRQVGSDTQSFANALKYALREDPDVVMIGEMRDLETIQAALVISETGHLTLATLHTNSAAESINRIIDIFPAHQQPQVRAQLAFVLEAVVTQQLLPRINGGRVLALEVMVATPALRAMIRDEKVHQVQSLIQAGQKYGMQTMNQSLFHLYTTRQIALGVALSSTRDPDELKRMIEQKSPVLV